MFMSLVNPGRGCCKGIILQGIIMPTVVLPNVQSCMRRKGSVTGVTFHATRQRNSPYRHTVRQSIYEPDDLNTLTHQSSGMNNTHFAPPLHSPSPPVHLSYSLCVVSGGNSMEELCHVCLIIRVYFLW